jgi:hypothetical protein
MDKIRSFAALSFCVLLFVSTISIPGTAAGQEFGPNEAEITGISVNVGPQGSEDIRKQANNILEQFPRQDGLNENILIVYSDTQGTIVISTDQPVSTGSIEASGRLYGENIPRRQSAEIDAVMIADSIEITEEAETEVTVDTLQQDPESVENELVEVTTDYRQLTANSDGLNGEVISTYRTGSLTPINTPLLGEGAIGDNARSFTREIAESDSLKDATGSIESQTRAVGFDSEADYWMDAEATITLAVVDEGPQHTFFISDVTVDGTETTIEDIQSGSHESGEIVTIRSSYAATRISVKETLVSKSECTADTFFVPNIGCVPAVADTVVEGGLLYNDNDRLLTAGVSNRIQNQPVVFNHSEVVVTGEVVKTDTIDPRADANYGLLIYDIDQETDLNSEDTPSEIKNRRDSLTNRLEQQLKTTAEDSVASQDKTPAADDSSESQESQQAADQDTSSQTAAADIGSSGDTGSTSEGGPIILVGVAGTFGGMLVGAIGVILVGVAAVGKLIDSRFTDISFKTALSTVAIGIILFIISTILSILGAYF